MLGQSWSKATSPPPQLKSWSAWLTDSIFRSFITTNTYSHHSRTHLSSFRLPSKTVSKRRIWIEKNGSHFQQAGFRSNCVSTYGCYLLFLRLNVRTHLINQHQVSSDIHSVILGIKSDDRCQSLMPFWRINTSSFWVWKKGLDQIPKWKNRKF